MSKMKKYERALETWVADDCQTHAKLQSPPWPVGCAWWVTRGSLMLKNPELHSLHIIEKSKRYVKCTFNIIQ